MIAAAAAVAGTVDPNDDGSRWAWAENIGWIDAAPEGPDGPGPDTSWDGVGGWLWGENAGWISASCENTDSCDDVDYGIDVETVVSEPSVEFRGWAWSENAGWISTACENTDSCDDVDYGVEIEVGTGDLLGWAWSENAGWISFGCEGTDSCDDVDYGVTIGPCPSISAIVPAVVPVGIPVVIVGTDLADPGHELPPRIFWGSQGPVPDAQIPTYDETTIPWLQILPIGIHSIRVQHQNGCLSNPSQLVVVLPASSSQSCGLLGIESAALLVGLALLRRRRAANLERT